MEETKELSNPADLRALADTPNVGNRTTTCTVPAADAHYYLLRLDYGSDGVSWVSIGASGVGGDCVLARNGQFVASLDLGQDADTAWRDGTWPAS